MFTGGQDSGRFAISFGKQDSQRGAKAQKVTQTDISKIGVDTLTWRDV